MSRGIRFKLYDQEEKLALAFQHHCHRNLGINKDLNDLVKLIFLKYLSDNVDKRASDPKDLQAVAEVVNGNASEAVSEGDLGTDAVASVSSAGTAALDTQAVSGEASPA